MLDPNTCIGVFFEEKNATRIMPKLIVKLNKNAT